MSFKVSKNTFRCFVCGASGGTIDLVMRHLHMDFKAACRWLANENNIILDEWQPKCTGGQSPCALFEASRYARFFEHPWLNDEARRFLFDERRLDPRVVRWCRLTSWRDKQGVPWLQTPYYDREGRLVGVQNRNLAPSNLPQKGEASPRFRFPQGSRCGIYNLPVLNLLRPGEPLFITEGCSDCWAMLSAGHKAIAIPSATLLTQDVRSKMADGRSNSSLLTLHSSLGITFHMFPDRDAPGERLFLQLQQVLPSIVHHQLPPDCKDFSDYYLAHKSG
jgi:DNA primase